jgi:hypothetical protein
MSCPREFFVEMFHRVAHKVMLVGFWGTSLCSRDSCSRKQRKVLLCSWKVCFRENKGELSFDREIMLTYFLRIVCSSNLQKIRFGDRDLRADRSDLWSDRRFVLRCHVLGLWISVMMAISRSIMSSVREEDLWPFDQSVVSLFSKIRSESLNPFWPEALD